MKSGFESGYCTGKFCRTFLRDGAGQQVQNPDGSLDRFCERHYHEWVHRLDRLEEIVQAVVVLLAPVVLFGLVDQAWRILA